MFKRKVSWFNAGPILNDTSHFVRAGLNQQISIKRHCGIGHKGFTTIKFLFNEASFHHNDLHFLQSLNYGMEIMNTLL